MLADNQVELNQQRAENNIYIWKDARPDNDIGLLSNVYLTSGIKVIKALVFSYTSGGMYEESEYIQPIVWKLMTIKINLNSGLSGIEDFAQLGGSDFTFIPWPDPGKIPVISGTSDSSNYYKSIESLINGNLFSETEMYQKYLLKKAFQNDEVGDYLGSVDLEQTRVFKGAYDMDQLLMIEDMVGEELITDEADRNMTSNTGFWDAEGTATNYGTYVDGVWDVDVSAGDGVEDGDIIENNSVIVPDKTYRVTYEVKNYESGGVEVGLGGTYGTTRTANGIYTEDIFSQGTTLRFRTEGLNGSASGIDQRYSIDNVSVKEFLTDIDDSTYNPYYDIYDEETNPGGNWGNVNNYPDFDESCVGMIFINDSLNTNLRDDCVIELNFGDMDGGQVIDTSGQGNTGIVLGDYSLTKDDKDLSIYKDQPVELPEKSDEERAI
jgi:hypothetical protein